MSGIGARLALGTVQLGLAYGATNEKGKVGEDEARALLELAYARGIRTLDTAAAYGEAETMIGRLGAQAMGFRIVTKTVPTPGDRIDAQAVAMVTTGIERSRRLLRSDVLDAVLVHHGRSLLTPGGRSLLDALIELRTGGTIGKLGVSVYDPDEMARLLELFTPDLVQLPLNVLDQRFIASGMLRRLSDRGVEVHARSLFLQGTLIAPPANLPRRLAHLALFIERFDEAARRAGKSRLAACLGFGLAQQQIANLVIGVTGAAELAEVLAATESVEAPELCEWQALASDDPAVVDPSRWPPG